MNENPLAARRFEITWEARILQLGPIAFLIVFIFTAFAEGIEFYRIFEVQDNSRPAILAFLLVFTFGTPILLSATIFILFSQVGSATIIVRESGLRVVTVFGASPWFDWSAIKKVSRYQRPRRKYGTGWFQKNESFMDSGWSRSMVFEHFSG